MKTQSKAIAAIAVIVATMSIARPSLAQTTRIAPESPGALGQWWTPGFSSRVYISRCGEHLCAAIAWLWDPASARKGQLVLKGLSPQNGRQWTGGTAFNPSDGNTYNASIELMADNRLKVSGCVLVFCQEQIWIRVGSIDRLPGHLPR